MHEAPCVPAGERDNLENCSRHHLSIRSSQELKMVYKNTLKSKDGVETLVFLFYASYIFERIEKFV